MDSDPAGSGGDDFLGYARVQLHTSMLGRECKVMLDIRSDKDSYLLKEYPSLGSLFFTFDAEGCVVQDEDLSATQSPSHHQQQQQQQQRSSPSGGGAGGRAGYTPPPRGTHNEEGYQQNTQQQQQYQQRSAAGGGSRGVAGGTKLRNVFLQPIEAHGLKVHDSTKVFGKVFVGRDEFMLSMKTVQRGTVAWATTEVASEFDESAWPIVRFQLFDSSTRSTIGDATVYLNDTMLNTQTKVQLSGERAGGDTFINMFAMDEGDQQDVPALRTPRSGCSLRILSASDLIARDLKGQASDPYVIVIGRSADNDIRQLHRTEVRHSSLNPVWNDTFMVADAVVKEVLELNLLVYDSDAYNKSFGDFLGEATIDLAQCPRSDGPVQLELVPRREGRDSANDAAADIQVLNSNKRTNFGTISVEWSCAPAAADHIAAEAASPQQQRRQRSPGGGSAGRSPAGARGTSRERGNSRERGGGPMSTDYLQSRTVLSVILLSATNLAYQCAPYARIVVENDVHDNYDPKLQEGTMAVWNFKSEFPVNEKARGDIPVIIEVRDARAGNRIIGIAHAAVPRGLQRQTAQTLHVIDTKKGRKNEVVGEVTAIFSIAQSSDIRGIPEGAALALTVVKANGIPITDMGDHRNPYCTLKVSTAVGRSEYRSATVRGTEKPLWYFSVPPLDVHPRDVFEIAVWSEDPSMGFDEFIGQSKFSVGALCEGSTNTIDMPLSDRATVDGHTNSSMNDFGGSNNKRTFGSVTLEWSLAKRVQKTASEPKVFEVAIMEGQNLAKSDRDTAVVEVTCDDQPSADLVTRIISKYDAHWNESIQMHVDGTQRQLRLSVFDDLDPRAAFLGEVFVDLTELELDSTGKVFTLPLRPRQDPRYHKVDVQQMNKNAHGFGTVKFMLRQFSIAEFERITRERLKERGEYYTMQLQVADTTNVLDNSDYFVKVSAGGEDFTTHVESGSNPKFRKNFNFTLYYATEMVSLGLFKFAYGKKVRVGEVSFPVSPPAQQHSTEPVTTWLNLNQDQPETSSKILIRWHTRRPDGQGGTEPSDVRSLQRELADARRRIADLTIGSPPRLIRNGTPTSPPHGGGGSPSRQQYLSNNSNLNSSFRPTLHGEAPLRQVHAEVISRIANYGVETNVVSCFITVPKFVMDQQRVVDMCVRHRVNGFIRQTYEQEHEVFAQQAPRLLVPLLEEAAAIDPTIVRIEEVRGYIPMLASGFSVAGSPQEGDRMFEICSTTVPGDSSRCWFYRVPDAPLPGVRYIDERGDS